MTTRRPFITPAALFLLALGLAPFACAQPTATSPQAAKPLVLLTPTTDPKRLTPSSPQVHVTQSFVRTAPILQIDLQPGADGYPGVALKPEQGTWDLSRYGHVEARVVNMGTKPLTLALRVDNAGNWQDNPWNTEVTTLAPGERGTIQVFFGFSYGHKPGYPLKSKAVTQLLLFAGKSDDPQSFRIESLSAAGVAGELVATSSPSNVREVPTNGVLLGKGTFIDSAKQLSPDGGATASLQGADRSLHLVFSSSPADASVLLMPLVGRWDLSTSTQVELRILNSGRTPASPRVRLHSNNGASAWVSLASPLLPGTEQTLIVPFAPAAPIDPDKPDTAPRLSSNAVSGVQIGSGPTTIGQTLDVLAITATNPVASLPDWLGKRPPVPGEWVQTLSDDFTGPTLNATVWDTTGENYYDKVTHWSKANITLSGGLAHLRFEKKTGFQNDDPKRNQTPYATGFLTSYGKWTQRYGYFEARMKLPRAPGLWPAFWLMPDRGVAAGEQWQRQDTGNGGMEFDILESLTGWGPYRYNIAMHYDGYDKNHKTVGSDHVYVQPDKDGFLTASLLWTPGLAVYYCNGREVFRWQNPRVSDVASCFLFTLPSGGWDNNALDDARLPDDFAIDYVRVWQRKDLATPTDGKQVAR